MRTSGIDLNHWAGSVDRACRQVGEGDGTGELGSWGGGEFLGVVGGSLTSDEDLCQEEGNGTYRKTVSSWLLGVMDQSQEL